MSFRPFYDITSLRSELCHGNSHFVVFSMGVRKTETDIVYPARNVADIQSERFKRRRFQAIAPDDRSPVGGFHLH